MTPAPIGLDLQRREEQKERVRDANPISELIQEYVPLQGDGRYLKALCPFHQEKTPSFKVHAEWGTYHCYGCGERGDVFSFLMKIENLGFPEALEQLAERGGVTLDRSPVAARSHASGQAAAPGRRRQSFELLARASQWFRGQLWGRGGEAARDYLTRRGFTAETLERFAVGFAPAGWKSLSDALLKADARATGSLVPLALELGLLRQGKSGIYDAFRGRIIFPIRNLQGRVVGFGGRHLQCEGAKRAADREAPKYINSPDSSIFRKGKVLFGQFEGRDRIRRERTALLMEGYTDVMMAHQCGFEHAVACLGTALTEEAVASAARHVDKLVLVYDGDVAGRRAALKAIALAIPSALKTVVVLLPEGLDPCEVLSGRTESRSFSALLAQSVPDLEFAADELLARGERAKETVAYEFFELLVRSPSAIRREEGLGVLARALEVPTRTVEREFRRWQETGARRKVSERRIVDLERAEVPEAVRAEEEAILLGAMTAPDQAALLLQLHGTRRFRAPGHRELARAMMMWSGKLNETVLEDTESKRVYLELHERSEREPLDEEQCTHLLRDLVVGRLDERAARLKQALQHASGMSKTRSADSDSLLREMTRLRRRILELRRPGSGLRELVRSTAQELIESTSPDGSAAQECDSAIPLEQAAHRSSRELRLERTLPLGTSETENQE